MIVDHVGGAQRARPPGLARGRDHPGPAVGGQVDQGTAGDPAGAVDQYGLIGPNGHGVQRLVCGESRDG